MKKKKPLLTKQNFLQLFAFTILSAYFHAFMEWLFFSTTPSTLSTLTWFESLKVVFITGGVIAFLLIIPFLILNLLTKKWTWLAVLPATFMLSVTALIMLDNFTYTVFKIGIVTTNGAWRLIYIIVYVFFFYWMFHFASKTKLLKSASTLTFGLLTISMVLTMLTYVNEARNTSQTNSQLTSSTSSNNRPNIIILGVDGLSSAYLSAYRYKEETTPFLNELIKESLVAENAFPNASSTTASTTSVLTGKEPAEVTVYRYPDILSGNDSFEHLPGILKDAGYQTVEIGTPSYVDARKLNLIDGFEIVNGQVINQPVLDSLRSILGNSPSTYFIQLIFQRISERLLHIFFIREMDNPIQQVNNPSARLTDDQRLEQIINLLETSDRPVFVFSHFMGTHGPHFSTEGIAPTDESLDEEKEWDVELYKAAIRKVDAQIETLYNYLAESGELDNTVIVIYTDHGYRYVTNRRTPLIIHFPNHEHAGFRKNNVQVIDIPVTLLDYLGISQPAWMTGSSILNDEPSPMREIISITAGSPRKIKPPFYQIKTVQIIVCNKWYSFNVQENIWKSEEITGHTATCNPALLPTDEVIKQKILDYLEKYEYDISSLE